MKVALYFVIAVALLKSQFASTYGLNGGIECAACTIVAGIFGQVGEIHSTSLLNISLNFCNHLLWPSKNVCRETITTLEPLLSLLIETRRITPDTFCYGLNFCHKEAGGEMCHLFPPSGHNEFTTNVKYIQKQARPFLEKWYGVGTHSTKAYSLCELPGVRDLCQYLIRNFNGMEPVFDLDGDKFSSFEDWRGSHWRGKDCLDFASNVYPGRQPLNGDVNFDANCNGIWGIDKETGIPWETKLCGDSASSKSRGIVMLGDSVGAHFHFPLVWFSPKLISKETFLRNATGPLLDELDWPQYSFSTGFKNVTEPELIQGKTDSIYLRMRKWNLCNHRDYQNICRNGDTSFHLVENVKNIARTKSDKPVTVLIGVVGNDVCNRYPDTLSNMTTPKQFYKNMKKVIKTLEFFLPPKSHVVLLGLVNGSFIFDTLANRIHPIGEYHSDVRYRDVFRWFECMQISPCNGWFSENKHVRDATSKRALELSHVLKDLASSYVSKEISISYVSNPLSEVLQNWKTKGGQIWQLFEPVDGFHPNQIAQPLIAEVLWKKLKAVAPDALGSINQFNDEIMRRFGNQGGH